MFLTACSSKTIDDKATYQILNFDKELTFNEFKMLIDKYSETASFPQIDK